MAEKGDSIDWREVVYRGVESQTLDYKAAQNWNDLGRVGKAKFARHVMAMANTRGGYIVVGVGEDENGNPTLYSGLTDAQLRSFDPSTVGQFINLFADPSIDFDIVRPRIDDLFYAIFVIRRFSGQPHVCSDHCGNELQQGAFYIRTPDARSRPAFRASELHGLIQRALRNQREVLGRMLRGVLYEGRQYPEPDTEHEFAKLLEEAKQSARQWLGPKNMDRFYNLEMAVCPQAPFNDDVDLSAIKRAAANVALPVPCELPFIPENNVDCENFLTNHSMLCRQAIRHDPHGSIQRFHAWQFFRAGLFHYIGSISERREDGEIFYPTIVNRIASAIELIGELYSELGLEDEIMTFTISLTNVEKCSLVSADGNALFNVNEPPRCYIPEIVVKKRRSVADLTSAPAEHATRVILEVCERFNLAADRHPDLRRELSRLFS